MKELKSISKIVTPKTNFECIVPFLYYIRVLSGMRNKLRDFLYDKGVDTGIHWQPGHWFSLLKECKRGDLSVTDKIGNEVLSLPLHSSMNRGDLEKIVQCIQIFFKT